MSVADLHDLELVWPSLGPADVIVTGTFDQWSSSIHLVKDDSGFSGTVKAPWGQKVAYKYIVDGRWRCRNDRPQEDDGHGNINNVLQTPEKPLPTAHDPPARLSIPLDGTQSDGYGDIENMVTAVEFFPPAEPAIFRGSLPLPIPQITVEGLSLTHSADTPVSEFKLNTAAATEGHVSPTSETPARPTSFKQAPFSYDVPVNDDGSVTLPSVNGNGEAHDSHDISTHVPIQSTNGELHTSPLVPDAKEAVVLPLESATPEPEHSLRAAQDTSAVTDRVDVPLAPAPAAALEPIATQPQEDLVENVAQGHRRHTLPAPIGQVSTPSIPTSSTLTHKKRRSLFARIKHIFDKKKDKEGGKEKNQD